jgi:hypothetical protein
MGTHAQAVTPMRAQTSSYSMRAGLQSSALLILVPGANEYKSLIPKGKGLSACTAMSIGTGSIAALVMVEVEETDEEKGKLGASFLGLLCSAIRPML